MSGSMARSTVLRVLEKTATAITQLHLQINMDTLITAISVNLTKKNMQLTMNPGRQGVHKQCPLYSTS